VAQRLPEFPPPAEIGKREAVALELPFKGALMATVSPGLMVVGFEEEAMPLRDQFGYLEPVVQDLAGLDFVAHRGGGCFTK